MRVVVVIGGRKFPTVAGTTDQRRAVQRTAAAIAAIAAHHAVVVIHGNGPQVGVLALKAVAFRPAAASAQERFADDDGVIGYMLERALTGALPGRRVATLVTQAEVSPDDPSFGHPTVPVGPVYDADKAARLAAEHRWAMAGGTGRFRRVLPAPMPIRILELETIRLLIERNVVVVCAGGGGFPVIVTNAGEIRGVEGVIDRDRSAVLLAEGLSADFLLMLTDTDAVQAGWGTPMARSIRRTTPDRLAAIPFDAATIGPKVQAACDFVGRTGGMAAIGAADSAAEVLRGTAGTIVVPGKGELEYRES